MELKAYLAVRGRTSVLARKLRVSPAYLYQMATNRRPVPAPLVPQIVEHSGREVREWDLRADDWHRIWPELKDADGAPEVEPQQQAA